LTVASPVLAEAGPLARLRAADYLDLTKPRIALLVLFTVAAGVLFASGPLLDIWLLINAVSGTALVAAGASALNQWLERDTDARMQRTENRPLPSGRLQPIEALVFGSTLGIVGALYLAVAIPTPWAAVLAAITFIGYVFAYTPLKPRTTLNTLVGAIPGALPPIIGWVAVRGSINGQAIALFLILFLWQVPHFLAIAWIYREDYGRAGLKMLPVVDPNGLMTGQRMIGYCLVLIPASLLPVTGGVAHPVYFVGAVVLGLMFLGSSVWFYRDRSLKSARRVLRTSLLYLPGLLVILLLDGALSWYITQK
jgi:protoheme IX farnesyltransferase